jgi:hypothetical protein
MESMMQMMMDMKRNTQKVINVYNQLREMKIPNCILPSSPVRFCFRINMGEYNVSISCPPDTNSFEIILFKDKMITFLEHLGYYEDCPNRFSTSIDAIMEIQRLAQFFSTNIELDPEPPLIEINVDEIYVSHAEGFESQLPQAPGGPRE